MNQIDVYRKMTGAQRLKQAMKLSALVRAIAISSIKNGFSNLSQREVLEKYREKLLATKHGRNRSIARVSKSF